LRVDTAAVNRYVLAPLRLEKLRAILVSHPHHDHFQDVPYILSQYPDSSSRPVVIGSRNVFQLLRGHSQNCGIDWVQKIGGLENTRTHVVEFTSHQKNCADSLQQISCVLGRFGDFVITALGSDHPGYDHLPGVAIDGFVSGQAPFRAAEYKTWSNTSIDFLIEYRGLRFFFAESPLVRHAGQVGRVDILVQGIAARRDGDGIASTLAALQPRYLIPTHYDNFFKPFTGFEKFDARFGAGPLDFSRFEDFVRGYEDKYIARARTLVKDNFQSFHPQLRLLKLFYYYSLEKLPVAQP
jgi:L-ascorbate metabolism protein UlaG (beta-lactamase superfamily)